jgi:hypothetical protein
MTRRKFALERFADGGLLLNLETGALYHLNVTAAEIWSDAMQSLPDQAIAERLSERYGIPFEVAQRDVAIARMPLAPAHAPLAATELVYQPDPDGYVLSFRGSRVVAYDTTGDRLRLLEAAVPDEHGIFLRALAPKIVAASGASVLHAAAVASPTGEVLAFLGVNGVGKTTTARTFAANGYDTICEDKLVWRAAGSGAEAILEGEPSINRWIRATAAGWANDRESLADTRSLAAAAQGNALPIRDVFLLQDKRAAGTVLEFGRLEPSVAALEILRNGFYGSMLPEDWRVQLEAISQLSRVACVYQVGMPEGLGALGVGVRTYIETTAS